MITQQKIQEIKNKIEELEFIQNRLNLMNGSSVEVKNIRIRGKKAIADLYFYFDERTERCSNQEYDLDKLELKE